MSPPPREPCRLAAPRASLGEIAPQFPSLARSLSLAPRLRELRAFPQGSRPLRALLRLAPRPSELPPSPSVIARPSAPSAGAGAAGDGAQPHPPALATPCTPDGVALADTRPRRKRAAGHPPAAGEQTTAGRSGTVACHASWSSDRSEDHGFTTASGQQPRQWVTSDEQGRVNSHERRRSPPWPSIWRSPFSRRSPLASPRPIACATARSNGRSTRWPAPAIVPCRWTRPTGSSPAHWRRLERETARSRQGRGRLPAPACRRPARRRRARTSADPAGGRIRGAPSTTPACPGYPLGRRCRHVMWLRTLSISLKAQRYPPCRGDLQTCVLQHPISGQDRAPEPRESAVVAQDSPRRRLARF